MLPAIWPRYVIEEQNAKNIVLNLGINETNSYDTDRSSLNESEHEKVSGENPLKFYLKYALCNPKYSVEKLQSARLDTNCLRLSMYFCRKALL